jgi:hypothetical protein
MHADPNRVRGQPQSMPNSICNRRENMMDTKYQRNGIIPSL